MFVGICTSWLKIGRPGESAAFNPGMKHALHRVLVNSAAPPLEIVLLSFRRPFPHLAGKMMGDKRATVAEKRFNRPLKRVLVANAGLLN